MLHIVKALNVLAQYGGQEEIRVKFQQPKKPRIKLENTDDDDDMVLITAEWYAVRYDQSIAGTNWEHTGDLAYAIVPNYPGLVRDLEEDYEVDDTEFWPA
jgi:hypothetical protein